MATVTAIERHPNDPGRIRLTISDPVEGGAAAGADVGGNYLLNGGPTPLVPSYANVVDGSSGTQVDLCFSPELSVGPGPLALWRFDEAGASDVAVDDVAGTYDLTPVNGITPAFGPVNRARVFDGDVNRSLQSTPDGATAALLQGVAVTVRAIARVEAGRTTRATLISHRGTAAATEAHNEQLRISIEVDGRITWMWETGAGIVVTGTSTRAVTTGRTFLIHLVRTITGTAYQVALTVNGDTWQLWNDATGAPTGGDDASCCFCVGRVANDTSEAWVGLIDTLALDTDTLGVIAPVEAAAVMFPFQTNTTYDLFISGVTDASDNPVNNFIAGPNFFPLDYGSEGIVANGATLVIVPQGSSLPAPPVGTAGTNDGSTLYGVEIGVFPDLGQSFQLVSGPRAIAEALYRRLSCVRETLAFHPGYGMDLRSRLNDTMSTEELFALKADVERECEKDERVQEVNASVHYTAETFTLDVTVAIVPAQGPGFVFVVRVDQLTAELIMTSERG